MKATAPNVDRLLRWFDHRQYMEPWPATDRIRKAMEPLFAALAPLAPTKENDEAKSIWLQISRGDITDYDSYEDLKAQGNVDSYDEYVKQWEETYPNEYKWYELVIVEGPKKGNVPRFRAVSLGHRTIVHALMNEYTTEAPYTEDAAVKLCAMITPAAKAAIRKIRNGTYNNEINASLPIEFRTGVIKRSELWKLHPQIQKNLMDGLSESMLEEFKKLMASGVNDEAKISRLDRMTANDFFRACAIGYKACGYKNTDAPLVDQYFSHADGRDEGLSGRGYGLNTGPGIDFDDPDAWDQWYFDRARGGGHPWEVIMGGNSTHVDLFVWHDQKMLGYYVRSGKLTQEEADKLHCGYYFEVAGKYRASEAVNFYVALSAAGLPVILSDAEDILARYNATGYVGVVPHDVTPRYCEGMFPEKYGRVIDFIHVYEDEERIKLVEWLPEDAAMLIEDTKSE